MIIIYIISHGLLVFHMMTLLQHLIIWKEDSELEEYTEQDVFTLCKVIGVMNKEKVEVFNPLKDFIKLPRAVRRGMDEDSKKGLESICVDGPVLKVEVIAIYK